MARRQICALLLVAAAAADVNETAASESRVTKFAAQSYDWLADHAPVASAPRRQPRSQRWRRRLEAYRGVERARGVWQPVRLGDPPRSSQSKPLSR